MELKDINLLITGGCGFIGSNFSNFFYNKVNKLVIIDKLNIPDNLNNIVDIINCNNVIFINKDINDCDFSAIYDIYNINYIIHLAEEKYKVDSFNEIDKLINNNILVTNKILESLKIHKIPIIYLSTDKVYGESLDYNKFSENDLINPSNPYAVTKASIELLIKSYIKSFDINAIIVRCNNVYGKYDNIKSVIPNFIYNACYNNPINIYSSDSSDSSDRRDSRDRRDNIRDFLYIEDLNDAILLLMSKGEYSEIYNVGVDIPLTIKELANIIIKKTNSSSYIKYIENRPRTDYRYYINCDKIIKLGWEPKHASMSSFIKNLDVLISSY